MASINCSYKKRDQSVRELPFSFNVSGPIIGCTSTDCKAASIFIFTSKTSLQDDKEMLYACTQVYIWGLNFGLFPFNFFLLLD